MDVADVINNVSSTTVLFNSIHSTMRVLIHQKQLPKSDDIEKIYCCYTNLLNHVRQGIPVTTSLTIFEDISTLLFKLSSDVHSSTCHWKMLSEECCLAIITTVRSLPACWTEDAWDDIYRRQNWPLIGHIVSVLLEMSEFASWRSLKVTALAALRNISVPEPSNEAVKEKVVNCMAYLLPGICHTLHRIIVNDIKVGSTVKEAALNTWGAVFQTVFSKIFCPETDVDVSFTSGNDILFSSGWYTSTLRNVTRLVSRTVDHLLHAELDVCISSTHRMASASLRWLELMLFSCTPAIFTSEDGQALRDVLVGAMIALATDSTSYGSSGNASHDSATAENVSTLARLALQRYVLLDKTGTKEKPDNITISPLPITLSNERLIRRIAMGAVLEHFATLLPHTLRILDEAQLQKRLRSILGYLELLDAEGLSVLSNSRDPMHRLCTCLADLLTMDTNRPQLCDANEPRFDADKISVGLPAFLFQKSFEWFRDAKTLKLVQAVASRIAGHGPTFDVFVDTCRDLMLQSGHYQRNPCLLLLSSALAGYLNNESLDWQDRSETSLRILAEYFDLSGMPCNLSNDFESGVKADRLNSNNPNRPLSGASDDCHPADQQSYKSWPTECVKRNLSGNPALLAEANHPKNLKDNVFTICILLELVATAAQVYDICHVTDIRAATEEFLRMIMLPCLDLASRPGLVGQTSIACLRQVARLCSYSSLSMLVSSNADYLVASITLDLHRVHLLSSSTPVNYTENSWMSPLPNELECQLTAACRALTTFFQYADIEVLPLLRPMIRQVLACLDITYEHYASLFLIPLYRLVATCRQWDSLHRSDEGSSTKMLAPAAELLHPFPCVTETEALQRYCTTALNCLRDQVRQTRRLHGIDKEMKSPSLSSTENRADSTIVNSPEEDSSRVYPDYLNIVEEVLLRCIHLMADPHPYRRMLSMDVITEGCIALRNEQDLLLPIVHKLWSALMSRFRDSEAIVVEKAFNVLTVLTTVAGDFLRSRTASDILPPLLTFLKRGAEYSAHASASYRYLTAYRVQRHLLSHIGLLCSRINLPIEGLRPAVRLLCLYVADTQPDGLQKAAIRSLQQLWCQDPSLVWITLLSLLPSSDKQMALFSYLLSRIDCKEMIYPIKVTSCADEYLEASKINTTRLSELLLQTLPLQCPGTPSQ